MSYEKEMLELAERLKARSVMLIVVGGERGTKLSMKVDPHDMPGMVAVLTAVLKQMIEKDSQLWQSVKNGGKEFVL